MRCNPPRADSSGFSIHTSSLWAERLRSGCVHFGSELYHQGYAEKLDCDRLELTIVFFNFPFQLQNSSVLEDSSV
jgi:hypothetical protein